MPKNMPYSTVAMNRNTLYARSFQCCNHTGEKAIKYYLGQLFVKLQSSIYVWIRIAEQNEKDEHEENQNDLDS